MDLTSYLNLLELSHELLLIGPMLAESPNELQLLKKHAENPGLLVDGGAQWRDLIFGPAFLVGDGDSHTGPMDLLLPAEKDFTDLKFALSLIPAHIHLIWALGFLGGRRDHEYANLGEIHHFLKSRTQKTEVRLGEQMMAFSSGPHEFFHVGNFGLFCLAPTSVKLTGQCRYRLENPVIIPELSGLGVSNEGTGKIHLEASGPAFVFLG